MKGQVWMEYIIILAVIVIIAGVAMYLAGGFSGTSKKIEERDSISYWLTTDIGIRRYDVNSSAMQLVVKNNKNFEISLTNITSNGIGILSTGGGKNITIEPGQSLLVTVNGVGCSSGEYQIPLCIGYKDTSYGNAYLLNGEKPIVGSCIGLSPLSTPPECSSASDCGTNTTPPSCELQSGALLDYLNIGDLNTEVTHNIFGWGPVEPATHGGYWGGADDGTVRTIWAPQEYASIQGQMQRINSQYSWATATLNPMHLECNKTLKIRVLNGVANDSFTVDINGNSVYSYSWVPGAGEYWVTHQIPIGNASVVNLKITATAPQWSSWGTYGQVGVSWIGIYVS
jgi:hypothetical protein